MGINKNLFYIFAALPLFISLNVNSSDSIPTIKEYINNPESYDSYVFGLESGLEWASEYYYRKHKFSCTVNLETFSYQQKCSER